MQCMNSMQQIAFENQNQNQNQNYTLLLKTGAFCERWNHCEKLCPTNFAQPQSTVASNHKLCKEGSLYHQKNTQKNPAFTGTNLHVPLRPLIFITNRYIRISSKIDRIN